MDNASLFAAIRSRPFGGSLSQDAVDGINSIVAAFQSYGDADARKLAYILGTAFHEADRFQTMREYASGEAYEGRADLGNTQTGDGRKYRGRGFVQITGRRNYTDWSKRLSLDLVNSPALAEQRPIAARILVEGMILGTFTGKKLADYITATTADFTNARRTVNGTDKAALIAGYAKSFEAALTVAGFGEVDSPSSEPVVDHSPPAAIPAPSMPVPAPKPAEAPVGSTKSKANGAAIGPAIISPVLLLMAKFGWIPAEVANDPETIIILTAVAMAGAAWLGAYFAPKNASAGSNP